MSTPSGPSRITSFPGSPPGASRSLPGAIPSSCSPPAATLPVSSTPPAKAVATGPTISSSQAPRNGLRRRSITTVAGGTTGWSGSNRVPARWSRHLRWATPPTRQSLPHRVRMYWRSNACHKMYAYALPVMRDDITQYLVDAFKHIVAQGDLAGFRVLFDLLGARGSDDGRADDGLAQHPGQRHLCQCVASLLRQLLQVLHGGQRPVIHRVLHKHVDLGIGGACPLRRRLPWFVFSGQNALGKWGEDNLADALTLAQWENFPLSVALKHVVNGLVRDDSVQIVLAGDAERVVNLYRRPLRNTRIEDFAL